MPAGTVVNNTRPADEVLNGTYSLGYTPPTLNDVEVDGSDQGKANAIQAIASPSISHQPSAGEGFEARVSNVPTNSVSFRMHLPADPPWQARTQKDYAAAFLRPDASSLRCDGKAGETTFSVHGVPDDARLNLQLDIHEHYHLADHIKITEQILRPWDTKLQDAMGSSTAFHASTQEEAEQELYRAMGGQPGQIATRLIDEWGAASDRFHRTDQGKTNLHSVGATEDCSQAWADYTVP